MQEAPRKAEPGEPAPDSRRLQGVPVMPGERDVNREPPVLREGCAADGCVPLGAAVPGRNVQGMPRLGPQRLQRIEKVRRVPIFPSAEPPGTMAGKLANGKMRPAPGWAECGFSKGARSV